MFLRNYSAYVVVALAAVFVSLYNLSSESYNWDISDKIGKDSSYKGGARINPQESRKSDLALVPLAKASTAVDPEYIEEEIKSEIKENSFISTDFGFSGSTDGESDGDEVKIYTVKEGDTVGAIAANFGITVNTILWGNDIDNVDSIMPGDTLFILPVAGVKHKIGSGDTIEKIAEKYKAEKENIITFNGLPANGRLEEGEEIVIPGGKMEIVSPQRNEAAGESLIEKRKYATVSGGEPEVVSAKRPSEGKPGTGHKFPYGQCTWWVSQKRYIPWRGNAGEWLYSAKLYGYQTGKTPKVGAIMVTTENPQYGHVAYVEKVSGDTITVSEMNFVGWGKISRRTISVKAKKGVIKGFIY